MRRLALLHLILLGVSAAKLVAGEDAAEPPTFYRFAGGERVRIFLPRDIAAESFEQILADDGTLGLPTGAGVNVKGKTLTEARQTIADQVEAETGAKRVKVGLLLLELAQSRIFFIGEVQGPKPVSPIPGTPLYLLSAIQEAGGLTAAADTARVNLVRTASNGTRTVTVVDLATLGNPGSADLGPRLYPGDVVLVPPAERFLLSGEVQRTGVLSRKDLFLAPKEPATLSRVLLGAGGLKPNANKRNVRILRATLEGERKVITVDLEALAEPPKDAKTPGAAPDKDKAEEVRDLLLLDGDMVVVTAMPPIAIGGGVAIMGKVKAPGIYPVAGGLKLSRLVVIAGGFSEFAKGSSVTIVRAKTPKTIVKVDVDSILKNGDWEKDVELEDGDIVTVSERML